MAQDWRPGTGQKIERLYAWVVVESDGGEGVAAASIGAMMIPLIGADQARVESLRSHAEAVRRASGCRVLLKVFGSVTVVEELV
jgi:hypothetical protein